MEDETKAKKYRVLFVDDDPGSRVVLGYNLIYQDFEVDIAKSGEEALEKINGQDAVVFDIDMGYGELPEEFISKCKKESQIKEYPYLLDLYNKAKERNPDIIVYLFSGMRKEYIAELGEKIGVGYFKKSVKDMFEIIDNIKLEIYQIEKEK